MASQRTHISYPQCPQPDQILFPGHSPRPPHPRPRRRLPHSRMQEVRVGVPSCAHRKWPQSSECECQPSTIARRARRITFEVARNPLHLLSLAKLRRRTRQVIHPGLEALQELLDLGALGGDLVGNRCVGLLLRFEAGGDDGGLFGEEGSQVCGEYRGGREEMRSKSPLVLEPVSKCMSVRIKQAGLKMHRSGVGRGVV